MRRGWSVVIIFLLFAGLALSEESAEDAENDIKNPIVISSELMDYDSGSITVREGKKLMINCIFERDDLAHKSDLSWKKSGGHRIDGESSPSLFSIVLIERGTNHKKTSLHFSSVHPRDSGFYDCSARTVGGEIFEKTVRITVLPKIVWADTQTVVGALIDEPLTINCNVKADGKEPIIQMSSGTGETLDESVFTIAGNEATIEHLKKENAGLIVSCVTIEMYGENKGEEFPVVDRKDVRIEVYHKPEFASEESIQYTVIDNHDRDVLIHCNVTSSFPAAKHFKFFHGDNEIILSDKYNILQDVGLTQGAHLHIRNVDENDLGTYRCEVSNSKSKSHHNIHLREANSPSEPKVTLVEARKHSIIWKIESIEKNSDMPITAIEIRHLRDTQADATGSLDEEISDSYWKSHSILSQKNINGEGLYEVGGLRHAHEYVWRFRQISEAGFGESVVLRAKTYDENDIDYTSSCSGFTLATLISVSLHYVL